ncbi:hypothetical protein ACLB2K_001300 [Fragaria x ananassa]
MQAALSPSQKALVAEQLLRHSDPHVKVSVASCITEITRITAPDAPYDDDPMKEAFQLIVSTFENLQNKPSRSYTKTTYILETVARVRSSSVKNVEEEVETHGIALADYSKVVASICSESASDTEKNGVHDDKDMIGLSYLSCCLSQLEILKINYMISWAETDSLPNLKCLELAFDEDNNYALLHIAFFIKQTPCLHTLVMKFRSWRCPKNPFAKKRAARYSHDCLKVVKFLEYSGLSRQIELVKYLMKTASNLEKIIFDPVNRQYSGVHRLLFPHIVEMEELSRAEAHQLKEKLPATLDVVCQ